MTIRRPCLWVIGLSCAVGLLGLAGAFAGYVAWRPPSRAYADGFDANLMANRPVVGRIVTSDPDLRSLMLRQTQLAYVQGGWPAANRVLGDLTSSEIAAYAGDDEALACDAAWQDAYKALLSAPSACRALLERRTDNQAARPAMTAANATCNAALIDGARRRQTTASPDVMTRAEYAARYAARLDGPAPLTEAERAALTDPARDDHLYCAAEIKIAQNLASGPSEIAARYLRTRHRFAGRENVVSAPPGTASAEAPPDLRCAPPGTIFILSIQGRDGLPITWQMVEQQGWNCRIRSSAAGERSLWGGGRDNPLELLWPLEVGKSAEFSTITPNGDGRTSIYSIKDYAQYRLPWATVGAYAIDEAISFSTGVRYVVTHFWSPELGFKIGQRARSVEGALPDWTAPDWQVIAIDGGPGQISQIEN